MTGVEHHTFDGRAAGGTESPDAPGLDCECRIEAYGDETLCTIHPRDADDDTLVTTWISARNDAFVDLADVR